MSTQRVRKNPSPNLAHGSGPKLQPIKATKVFSLRQGSPVSKASPSSSPTPLWPSGKNRRSPDHRASPERRSPTSPGLKGTKPPRTSPSPSIRRTSSLDTIAVGSYLKGIWPHDIPHHYMYGPQMVNKATQTPSSWLDADKRGTSHKRSASWGSADQLKEKIRQQLQRNAKQNNHRDAGQRQSPVPGDHSAIQQSPTPRSIPIPIPITSIPKGALPRLRNSVEGLNQEIERALFITAKTSGNEEERTQTAISIPVLQEPTPDGHRAPLPGQRSTRTVDTQTPYENEAELICGDSSGSGSRSQSVSPSFPGERDGSHPSSRGSSTESPGNEAKDKENISTPSPKYEVSPKPTNNILVTDIASEMGSMSPLPKYAASPKPNNSYSFAREPPDGCEKVSAIDESKSKVRLPLDQSMFFCPDKNKINFIPFGSASSAFCPILNSKYKALSPVGSEIESLAVKSPASQPTAQPTNVDSTCL
ncbi:PREDICTED: protein FAM117B-like isoform X1 [Branchiostoma belcheri]|uniref:Protein FAM117B-like isoform X1 n=1 Tax=Branchiostoma belcheri TaxID=7741 RepID=A0A6P4ZYQ2_BRABE|nr:PREDICTED: protein FAM117B-like isoform X1 [Branchiostoma belcheri]